MPSPHACRINRNGRSAKTSNDKREHNDDAPAALTTKNEPLSAEIKAMIGMAKNTTIADAADYRRHLEEKYL